MNTQNNIPAIHSTLTGFELIEASAGTGKTWTLTGIILRLLIEKKYAPERIIATTFTRAAAAEMQERIYARLMDFYECCQWLSQKLHENNLYQMDKDDRLTHFKAGEKTLTALGDLVNQHLLNVLLDSHPKELTLTLKRIELLLTTLNKLFVGTLDSLAQKWLREFKAEIGYDENVAIVTNPDDTIYAIVHDVIRQEQARLYHDAPLLYGLVGDMGDTAGMINDIKDSLNFFSAPIDVIDMPSDDDVVALDHRLQSVLLGDFSEILACANQAFWQAKGAKKNGGTFLYIDELKPLIMALQADGLAGFGGLDEPSKKLLAKLNESDVASSFKKDTSGFETWQAFDGVHRLYELGEIFEKYQALIKNYKAAFRAFCAVRLRDGLKSRLTHDNKTTFYLQTDRLNAALRSRQGKLISQHIRHLYPVALIDESQDVSGEQVELIRHIYPKDGLTVRNFVLFVGDPKQAIYRFRGGDVANYNQIKALGVKDDLKLTTNRRSHKGLVAAVNDWYGSSEENAFNAYTDLGECIDYTYTTAFIDEFGLSSQSDALPTTPLTVLHMDKEQDELALVAGHINRLLQSDIMVDGARPLLPSDIAVLARTKDKLAAMSHELDKLNIPVVSALDESVFDGQMAKALYWLLVSVATPKPDHLSQLFISPFYGYDWQTVERLLNDDGCYAKLSLELKFLREIWQQKGAAVMLNTAFDKPVGREFDELGRRDGNLWERLARHEFAERYLTDVWQLFELIAGQDLPVIQLIEWLKDSIHGTDDDRATRIALPSESGVQLMTIHRSKGLEFKIVYVLGLASSLAPKDKGLYAYTDEQGFRRFSSLSDKMLTDKTVKEKDADEAYAEEKRLGYVALTRASELCFVVVKDLGRSSDTALNAYLEQQKGAFSLPSRLAERASSIGWQELSENSDENIVTATPYQATSLVTTPIDYAHTDSIYQKNRFIGISKTSFTSLAGGFVHGMAIDAPLPDYDEIASDETASDGAMDFDIALPTAQDGINMTFVRGTQAGSFLHKLLEGANDDSTATSELIDRLVRMFKLPNQYLSQAVLTKIAPPTPLAGGQEIYQTTSEHEQLKVWLNNILKKPLMASGVAIKDLQAAKVAKEMKFVLSLDSTKAQDLPSRIYELFLTLTDKSLLPLKDAPEKLYGYLSGEIDLVYEHDGKYYVVDYKSNYLGKADNRPHAYSDKAMSDEMDKHGYWLQAAIYQLALYRLLRLRIADFVGNESRYLGAVEYYFVRAVSADDGVVDNRETGSLTWQVPLALIVALDELFG